MQEDALQHVFWTMRYRDPELFRDDLFADFYQSSAPPEILCRLLDVSARRGSVSFASKLLPLALGCVAALFTFLLVRHLHPSPGAAFPRGGPLEAGTPSSTTTLRPGTPRSFLLPLLTALVWAISRMHSASGRGDGHRGAALSWSSGGVIGVAGAALRGSGPL